MYNVFGIDMTYSKTYTLQPGLICNIFKIQFKILKSDKSVLIKSIRQFSFKIEAASLLNVVFNLNSSCYRKPYFGFNIQYSFRSSFIKLSNLSRI